MKTKPYNKYLANRDAAARLREDIIYRRYFLNGEHLEKLGNELGYKSLSAIEKAVARVRKKYNLPTKREMTDEAIDDALVIYSEDETYLVFTAKQIEQLGFKPMLIKYSLINETYTKMRFNTKWKVKYQVCLARDYQVKKTDSKAIRIQIAKIKTRELFAKLKG